MAQRTVLVDKSKADFAKKDGKWAVGKLEVYDQAQGKYVERKIEADEEVEASKLDALQRALTDLKIVDAVRKPKSLAADLQLDKTFLTNQASPVWQDEQAFDDLQLSGFRLNQKQDKTLEIVSHDGDMIVGFTNGIRLSPSLRRHHRQRQGRGRRKTAKAAMPKGCGSQGRGDGRRRRRGRRFEHRTEPVPDGSSVVRRSTGAEAGVDEAAGREAGRRSGEEAGTDRRREADGREEAGSNEGRR